MMNKEFVPYQEALDLKELGFNKRTLASYHTILDGNWVLSIDLSGKGQFEGDEGACLAPTYSQAFSFFREKYGLHQYIRQYYGEHFYFHIEDMVYPRRWDEYTVDMLRAFNESTSQEESELACLQKLIEIVKPKQHE